MNIKSNLVALSSVLLGLLLISPSPAQAREAKAASKVEVHATYKGAGTVDDKHRIYIVLWDTPDFVKGAAMPVEMKSISTKDGSVTFDDVKTNPAYISTLYDASGSWDAQSAPPEGCSLGLYSQGPGQPKPVDVKSGETATVEVAFDDTVKMKGGAPGVQ